MSLDRLIGSRFVVVGSGAMATATAAAAASAGAQVTVSSRDAQRAEAAAAAAGPSVQAVTYDPEQPDEVSRLLSGLGGVDHVAVLMGGSGAGGSSIPQTPPRDAHATFERYWITYNVLHTAATHLAAGGSVTVLSGSSGRRGVAGLGVWGALHGSIEALARAAALELSPIRVNVVSPGGIGIGMDRQLTPHRGTADDIADAVLTLAASPAITGAVLDVDGGERLGTYGDADGDN